MQFRLTEGGGECRYLIGVNDNGSYYGLETDTLNETISVINQMAKNLNAETKVRFRFPKFHRKKLQVTRERRIGDKMACEILVRQHSTTNLCTQQENGAQ